MKRFISNAVLHCDNAEEVKKVEKILAEKCIIDYSISGTDIEVCTSMPPFVWQAIIELVNKY